jgi:hypothetical protein
MGGELRCVLFSVDPNVLAGYLLNRRLLHVADVKRNDLTERRSLPRVNLHVAAATVSRCGLVRSRILGLGSLDVYPRRVLGTLNPQIEANQVLDSREAIVNWLGFPIGHDILRMR